MPPSPSQGRPISLRLRLTLVPALIGIALVLGIAAVEIGLARHRVDSERASAGELADRLIGLAVAGVSEHSADPLEDVSKALREMDALRHIRLFVLPRDEAALRRFRDGLAEGDGSVPGWFAALLHQPPWERWRPVGMGGRPLGHVVAAADPFDEMAELWDEMQILLALLIGLTAAFVALVAWSVARASRPVHLLTEGLRRLEQGEYDSRLQPFAITELEPLADTFNALAGTLRRMDDDNRRLIARLLSIQEAERNLLAAELHDEMGPTLFGIRVHASCLKRDPGGTGAAEILGLADELQRLNRRILDRLRPSRLHDLGLEAALAQLVADWSQRLPELSWDFHCRGLDTGGNDELALTLYRIAQEALTNAARHAQARCIRLEVRQGAARDLTTSAHSWSGAADEPVIAVAVSDDGKGFDPTAPGGFGLTGMRERVRCRRGRLRLDSGSGTGTKVEVLIPVGEAA